ncbi:MAG: DUF4185 domain-containing protein [Lentisphaeria bacterium]|nr:DUF4185 domain-containing protein [Lentisphaeria bacterium]
MNHRTTPDTTISILWTTRWEIEISIMVTFVLFLASFQTGANAGEADSPYPQSPVFAGITFDKTTWVKAAPGSDQFGTTWAADGNLYVSWGDGGGFGGTNKKGRVKLGIARFEGTPPDWRPINVWGGVNPLSKQRAIPGKTSSGVIAIGGAIYLFVVEEGVWTNNHMWKSADLGMTWKDLGPVFNEPKGAYAAPGIIQFGRDYADSRDDYVYGYTNKAWRDGMALFRVPKTRLPDRKAYEFFAGLNSAGAPQWTADIAKQKPVFKDPNGTEWGATCVFHPVHKRYLLAVRHSGESGEWGLFDAPEPWGPWSTIAYGKDIPEWVGTPDPKGTGRNPPAWMHTFPAKWMSPDGKTMWQISDRSDVFNLVKVEIHLQRLEAPADTLSPIASMQKRLTIDSRFAAFDQLDLSSMPTGDLLARHDVDAIPWRLGSARK